MTKEIAIFIVACISWFIVGFMLGRGLVSRRMRREYWARIVPLKYFEFPNE